MKVPFAETWLGRLRAKIGNDLVLVPCVRVVLERDNAIVMVRRTDNGLWALPAGLAEAGASIEDAARREVQEETGLTLGEFTCYGYASDPAREIYTYPNGHQIQSFCVLVWSKDFSGTIGDFDDEVSEARYFLLDQLPPAAACAPNEYRSILGYIDYKKTGLFQWL